MLSSNSIIRSGNSSLLLGVVISYCTSRASHQNYNLPIQGEPSFSLSGQNAVYDNWWRYLEDENLNTYIETALENNFTLASAWERLNVARVNMRIRRMDKR